MELVAAGTGSPFLRISSDFLPGQSSRPVSPGEGQRELLEGEPLP